MTDETPEPAPVHRRRPRYHGKHPRRYEDKYKEYAAAQHPDTVAKVLAAGKTPAGQHIPIMVREILDALALKPGDRCVDCTLGFGGHAEAMLRAVQPGGMLLGLDRDPVEIVKTEARLRRLDLPDTTILVKRINFAGMERALNEAGWTDGADAILADLGVSSMQIDNPSRGFSFKHDGPLDMRMDPERGVTAGAVLKRDSAEQVSAMLAENADEPLASLLGPALAGKDFARTRQLRDAVLACLPRRLSEDERDATVRRVFQALRIAVNEEFGALDAWLRVLPACLRPGGHVAVLTFHSGEDRRVKKAFQAGERAGTFARVSDEVVRADADERRANPRASSAKLRWAVKA